MLYDGTAVDLDVAQRPLFIQDAQADLAVARHRPGLLPACHRGDQHVVPVAVHHVVDDGHGRAVLLAAVAEDAGPVITDELPTLCLIHNGTLARHTCPATRAWNPRVLMDLSVPARPRQAAPESPSAPAPG